MSRPGRRPGRTRGIRLLVRSFDLLTKRSLGSDRTMSTRRSQLTREAARLFAEKGYHGTSIGDLAKAMGVQKGSLYAPIDSKQDLLYEAMTEGARAFQTGLDSIPDDLAPTE